MDAQVVQALAKWPNVPHCYGWLALDARGNWRMRNEAAQAQQLPGDKIAHPALIGFIQRNYTCDAQGRYNFQNGPQRVYVDLEIAPYIAHTDPVHGFVLHTGEPLECISSAHLTDAGRLFLHGDDKFAALDDRDMALCLPHMKLENRQIEDEELLSWLAHEGKNGALSLQTNSGNVSLHYIKDDELCTRFHFIRQPRAGD